MTANFPKLGPLFFNILSVRGQIRWALIRNRDRSQVKSKNKVLSEIFNRWRTLPGQSREPGPSGQSGPADDSGGETDERTEDETELEETNENDKKGYYPIWRHDGFNFN